MVEKIYQIVVGNIYRKGIKMRCIPIIPSYNPDETLLKVIEELFEYNYEHIIIVDDGSENKEIFNQIKKDKKCHIITHDKNMGKGCALKTGIKYYQEHFMDKYKGVVTLDCDGQHSINDILRVSSEMLISHNFVLGSRNFESDKVPKLNKFGNKLSSFVFYHLYGIYLRDTQSGLRAFTNEVVPMMLEIPGTGFEYEMNVLVTMVKNKVKLEQLPTRTVYLEARHSNYKPIIDSIRISRAMLKKRR